LVELGLILPTLLLFLLAALAEIGGGYLIWLWLKNHKGVLLGLIGAVILFMYGIIPTLQPANFGRVYAAYGGIFIISSIVWGFLVDRKKPDRYEISRSIIAFCGGLVIFYSPRQ
jgi:small multidrug resistance family-3 protein